MKRKLLVEAYEPDPKTKAPVKVRSIICGHLDASRNITILSESQVLEKGKDFKLHEFHIPEAIDHFNIYEGLITIYYKNDCFLEVSRIAHPE